MIWECTVQGLATGGGVYWYRAVSHKQLSLVLWFWHKSKKNTSLHAVGSLVSFFMLLTTE